MHGHVLPYLMHLQGWIILNWRICRFSMWFSMWFSMCWCRIYSFSTITLLLPPASKGWGKVIVSVCPHLQRGVPHLRFGWGRGVTPSQVQTSQIPPPSRPGMGGYPVQDWMWFPPPISKASTCYMAGVKWHTELQMQQKLQVDLLLRLCQFNKNFYQHGMVLHPSRRHSELVYFNRPPQFNFFVQNQRYRLRSWHNTAHNVYFNRPPQFNFVFKTKGTDLDCCTTQHIM